ncbi:DUF1758 domain-containing protein [Nephila pilipes]|uniref:DUF1758 domain-containing protein n=1 Tax=Nephila pilipes TaxID=299642 RepID=A0A8X6PJA0_NEPPI|nr:DUF1758 domain-containing protein [Nephila pilipes]
MDLHARKSFVKRNLLCFLCLNSHKYKESPNNNLKCSICKRKHNSLLHEDIKSNSACVSDPKPKVKQPVNQTAENICQRDEMLCNESSTLQMPITSSTFLSKSKCISFIPTANVLQYNKEGDSFLFRALLDSGSESSFVSENVINILVLRRKSDGLSLNGINGVPARTTRGSVVLKIGSRLNEELITVNAHILNKVTSQIPTVNIDIKELDYLKGVPLYDQNLQKIVWRNSSDSAIKEYRLSTVTYGTSSAPFLATKCLQQIGLDSENMNPEISNIIQNYFCMDDLMAGAKSNEFTKKEITLHGFSHASESAYDCVVYAVQRNDNGVTKVTILAAKSKIPKLSFPDCLHFIAIGSHLSPTGLQRSWTTPIRTDGGTYRPRRIPLILGLGVFHPRICQTVVYGGKTLVSYHH